MTDLLKRNGFSKHLLFVLARGSALEILSIIILSIIIILSVISKIMPWIYYGRQVQFLNMMPRLMIAALLTWRPKSLGL